MTILPILVYPNPILLKKSRKINDPQSLEIQELIFDMLQTMDANDNCLGLAAPQIGKSLRLCIIKLEGKTYIIINPKFKSKSWKKVVFEEGCLSFPGLFIPVKRSAKVSVKAQDKTGKAYDIKADNLLARALQHEIDHLDGIPFTKRKAKVSVMEPLPFGGTDKKIIS